MRQPFTFHIAYALIGISVITGTYSTASAEYLHGDESISGSQIIIGYSGKKTYDSYQALTIHSIKYVGSDSSGIQASGGAFQIASGGKLTISNNGSATIVNNTVASARNRGCGGAIFNDTTQSTVDIFGNGIISFENNQATASTPRGGAIYGGTIHIHDNELVTFKNNQTKKYSASVQDYAGIGGAICLYEGDSTLISGNNSVVFDSNKSVQGGAIYARRNSGFRLQNNGTVSFVNNIVHSETSANIKGAAIYGRDSSINISNNDSVIFRGNAQITNDSVVLRSIYLETVEEGYGTPAITLTAKTGGEISFYDSIYVGNNVPITLNKDASGTIIFTGESTEEDLSALSVDYPVPYNTLADIEASRTSNLLGTTTLYDGNLIIKEKAVLNINNFSVLKGAVIVASDAQLNLGKKNLAMPTLTLAGGTVTLGTEDDHAAALSVSSLTVTDNSTLNADLVIADNGRITFDFSGSDEKKLTMGCSVTLGNDYTVYLDHATITTLMRDDHADGLTLIHNIESIQDILLADNVRVYETDTNEESDILLYTQTESDGTKSLRARRATPEPATATLSLLALAAFAARRRRQ